MKKVNIQYQAAISDAEESIELYVTDETTVANLKRNLTNLLPIDIEKHVMLYDGVTGVSVKILKKFA